MFANILFRTLSVNNIIRCKLSKVKIKNNLLVIYFLCVAAMLDLEVRVGEKLLSFEGSLPVSGGIPSDLDLENFKFRILNTAMVHKELISKNECE